MNLSILPYYQHIHNELQTAWEEVQTSGTSRIVLIEGPNGSYKTQIIKEFLQTSQVAWVSGHGSGIPVPYLPLQQIFESLVRLAPVQEMLTKDHKNISDDWKMALTSLAQILPLLNLPDNPILEALKHWQSTTSQPLLIEDNIEPGQQPRTTTLPRLLTLALGEIAALLPFALLIENLDLAGNATIEAFTMDILRALQNSHILIIATFATANREQANPLSYLIHSTLDIPQTRHLKLSPLNIQDVTRILSDNIHHLQEENLSNLAQQVHNGSNGIPVHVLDLVMWLASLSMKTLVTTTEVPSHNKFIQTQFTALPDKARNILQIASVQGMYFCLEAVCKASEEFTAQIVKKFFSDTLSSFAQLSTTSILHGKDLHWYHFQEQYIRNWVYDTLSDYRRLKLHYDTALALEHLYGEGTKVIAGQLAEQFEKGEIPEKAAYYFAIAAHQANNQGTLSEGQKYARQGLRNLDAVKDELPALWCQLLLEQGRALKNSEESHYTEDILRKALNIARDIQDLQLEMKITHHLGDVLLSRNVWDEGINLVEQAIELAIAEKAWKIVVEGMERLRTRYHKQDRQAFLSLCDRMVIRIQQDSSPEVLLTIAEILEDKGWMQYYQSKHSQALETLDQAFSYLRLLEHPESYPDIHYKIYLTRARILRLLKEYTESLEEADKAIEWAYVSHSRTNIAWARDTKATTLRRMGEKYLEKGKQEYEITLKLLHSSSDLVTLASIEAGYGLFLSYSGYRHLAKKLYVRSYEHRLAANDLCNLQISRNNIAAIDKYLGSFQSALSEYQQLFNEGLIQGNISRQSISLNHIGDIYRILNRLNEAETAHSQVITLCDEVNIPNRKAIALQRLGQAYLCGWQLSKARAEFYKVEMLLENKTTFTLGLHEKNRILMERLKLCEGRFSNPNNLEGIIKITHRLHQLVSIGIGYLNLGLAELIASKPEKALSAARNAKSTLDPTESWRTTEVHHLLARCYLALGELHQAQSEIKQAKEGFMDLGLFHRVYQAESTELRIQETQESRDLTQWQKMSQEELRYDFNHLGI